MKFDILLFQSHCQFYVISSVIVSQKMTAIVYIERSLPEISDMR